MIRILSPVTSVIPSTTLPLAKAVANVPVTVVATFTDAFTSSPCATESTYCFVAACNSLLGSAFNVTVPGNVTALGSDNVIDPVDPDAVI